MGVSVINSYLGSSIPLPSILMDELRLVLLASILRSKNFRFVNNLKVILYRLKTFGPARDRTSDLPLAGQMP